MLTLSAKQVTERLNTKGRYRYRGYLAPAIPILRQWIEHLGDALEGETSSETGAARAAAAAFDDVPCHPALAA